jgi:hypothetical protein
MGFANIFKVKVYGNVENREGTAVGETTEQTSKLKIGSFVVALAAILGTIGGYLTGTITLMSGIMALGTEVGALLAVFGISELPILNSILSVLKNVSTEKSKK